MNHQLQKILNISLGTAAGLYKYVSSKDLLATLFIAFLTGFLAYIGQTIAKYLVNHHIIPTFAKIKNFFTKKS